MGCSQASSALSPGDVAARPSCEPQAEFTYKGWQKDLKQAQITAVSYPSLLARDMQEMERKQKVHIGDRSSPELQAIDAVKDKITYKGWRRALKEVEELYVNNPSLINIKLKKMERKQQVHMGDRSSPELQAIDAVKDKFTYTGWQKALKEVEELYVKHPSLINKELKKMERKQQVHMGDRSSTALQAIDAVTDKFTYKGWKKELKAVEALFVDTEWHSSLIDTELQKMERKQQVHVGDRSSAELQAIDAVRGQLTYKRWQKDLKEAEDLFVEHPTLMTKRLEEIKLEQKLHIGEANGSEIDTLNKLKAARRRGDVGGCGASCNASTMLAQQQASTMNTLIAVNMINTSMVCSSSAMTCSASTMACGF
jgi:hypothetical protein